MESILVLVSFLAVGTVGIFVVDGLDSFLQEAEQEREKKEPKKKQLNIDPQFSKNGSAQL